MTCPLPNGWRVVKIGELTTLLRGVTYKKSDSASEERPGYVPILRATNIGERLSFDDLVHVSSTYISRDQMLRAGDIVVAASSGSRAVVGKAALLDRPWHGSFGAFCFVLRPSAEGVSSRFLAYFMATSAYRNKVSALAAGVNINNLKRDHIESLEMPLAPPAQQERIAQALDEEFTKLDSAITSLHRVQANLKRYRASVLKAAVEGRLVPTEAELARREGRAYEPAKVLLDRILAERRRRWEEAELRRLTAKGRVPKDDQWKSRYITAALPEEANLPALPEGWIWATLDQLCEAIQYGYTASSRVNAAGPRFLRITDIQDGQVSWADVPGCEIAELDVATYLLQPRDLVFARTGATTGKSYLIRGCPEAVFASYLIRCRPLPLVEAEFIYAFFQSPGYWQQIGVAKRGVGQPNVNGRVLAGIHVPIPPATEQVRIVSETDRLLCLAQTASVASKVSLMRCHQLRNSVLRWAFSGKLVDQDPTDEPADLLLARIRDKRTKAAAPPDPKPRNRRSRSRS